MREPDWAALSDLQFLLYNRIADSLNAALSAIALSDMPEAQDKPPGFWKGRATTKVSGVLNLYMAWSYLIRYKMGETIPERAVRPFRVNALLGWLASQLQLSPVPIIESNPLLQANQETIQEALLLLYSAAFTQGANVRLDVEPLQAGVWFRVKFSRRGDLPENLDALLATFKDHWRSQDTAFELLTARDFVRLNGYELVLNSVKNQGELVFFVREAGKIRVSPAAAPVSTPTGTPVQLKDGGNTPVFEDEPAIVDKSTTPVIVDKEATPILTNLVPMAGPAPKPPRLSEIRPWPSIGVPAPIPPSDSASTEPAGGEGKTGPVEPEDTTHLDDTRVSKATVVVPLSELNAVRPEVPKPAAPKDPDHDTVIISVKLPSPQLPKILDSPAERETEAAEEPDAAARKVGPPDTAARDLGKPTPPEGTA